MKRSETGNCHGRTNQNPADLRKRHTSAGYHIQTTVLGMVVHKESPSKKSESRRGKRDSALPSGGNVTYSAVPRRWRRGSASASRISAQRTHRNLLSMEAVRSSATSMIIRCVHLQPENAITVTFRLQKISERDILYVPLKNPCRKRHGYQFWQKSRSLVHEPAAPCLH